VPNQVDTPGLASALSILALRGFSSPAGGGYPQDRKGCELIAMLLGSPAGSGV
jgi:hypothetical protein